MAGCLVRQAIVSTKMLQSFYLLVNPVLTCVSVASELNERDWSVIARTNCLLSGQRLVVEEKTIKVRDRDNVVTDKKVQNHLVERRTPFSGMSSVELPELG